MSYPHPPTHPYYYQTQQQPQQYLPPATSSSSPTSVASLPPPSSQLPSTQQQIPQPNPSVNSPALQNSSVPQDQQQAQQPYYYNSNPNGNIYYQNQPPPPPSQPITSPSTTPTTANPTSTTATTQPPYYQPQNPIYSYAPAPNAVQAPSTDLSNGTNTTNAASTNAANSAYQYPAMVNPSGNPSYLPYNTMGVPMNMSPYPYLSHQQLLQQQQQQQQQQFYQQQQQQQQHHLPPHQQHPGLHPHQYSHHTFPAAPALQVTITDPTGQKPPPNIKPKITTTLWEDENTLCFQVDARGISVARREDNNMINGTKLLNVVGMSRGRRDGILKGEKSRHVVKAGAMHLKGVWIPYERALYFANREKIIDLLYPLFVHDLRALLYHPANLERTQQVLQAAEKRKAEIMNKENNNNVSNTNKESEEVKNEDSIKGEEVKSEVKNEEEASEKEKQSEHSLNTICSNNNNNNNNTSIPAEKNDTRYYQPYQNMAPSGHTLLPQPNTANNINTVNSQYLPNPSHIQGPPTAPSSTVSSEFPPSATKPPGLPNAYQQYPGVQQVAGGPHQVGGIQQQHPGAHHQENVAPATPLSPKDMTAHQNVQPLANAGINPNNGVNSPSLG